MAQNLHITPSWFFTEEFNTRFSLGVIYFIILKWIKTKTQRYSFSSEFIMSLHINGPCIIVFLFLIFFNVMKKKKNCCSLCCKVYSRCKTVGKFQMAFLHPWRALREGDAICRDVLNESEQLNPFTKGPFKSPLAKGTCDGHFTEVISVCDHVIFR